MDFVTAGISFTFMAAVHPLLIHRPHLHEFNSKVDSTMANGDISYLNAVVCLLSLFGSLDIFILLEQP